MVFPLGLPAGIIYHNCLRGLSSAKMELTIGSNGLYSADLKLLTFPKAHRTMWNKAFLISGPFMWNTLQLDLKHIKSDARFWD